VHTCKIKHSRSCAPCTLASSCSCLTSPVCGADSAKDQGCSAGPSKQVLVRGRPLRAWVALGVQRDQAEWEGRLQSGGQLHDPSLRTCGAK